MEKSDLTVITVVANDNGFVGNMINSVYRFTNPKPKIIICDNGGSDEYLAPYKDDPDILITKNIRAHKYNNNKLFGNTSWRHGIGLNNAFVLTSSTRTAIVEPDCAVLKEGWDTIPDGYEMRACRKGVGTEGEHYYHPCFMVFYTDALKRDGRIDWRPDGGDGIVIPNTNGKTYSDVAWKVYTKIPADKVDEFEDVRYNNERADKFHTDLSHKTNVFIDSNGNIVGTHFWRGSELSRRGDNAPVDKNLWMSLVKEVVGNDK